ncbi:hypothetical protein [Pontibacter amylolyticus]|uniref:Uncharacterized protein n=1 Tax=Pontibacter amylolyticus TaxID=1424080 RepID=A0ABQ1VW67_9BACT|nr:hypothetical protein [Pontibacter amylolyticus]GGF99177.1 hypothetical protein GCM10011323_00370 [Pontibacter amylolyticus]
MTALTPDQLNSEFLRHFMPETLYWLPEEQVAEVSAPAVEEAAIPVVSEKAEPKAIPTGPTAPVPTTPPAAIPKLLKVEKAELPKSFEVIGENRKGLVVLVTLPDPEFRALPQSDFLIKILAAIGFGPADVAFVNNVSGATTKFEALCDTLQTNYILSFASRLDTDLPHDKFTLYNPVVVGRVPVVFSQSLAVLDGDQEQKKLLWGALQRVFKK